MIIHYYRPINLEEALKLLSQPHTRPMGGGTVLTQQSSESFSVVDLQSLDLDKLHKSGNTLEIGATVTLQTLMESPLVPQAVKTTIKIEAPLNLRNMGTIAGTLVTCDGRSPFGTIMLAMDARCLMVNDKESMINLGDLLPLRVELLHGKLITRVNFPLNVKLAFETIARTPVDKPILCAAMTQWPTGRTRLALGGWGKSPSLVIDGKDASGIEQAARNATHDATDEWASADYRSDIAAVLSLRCLKKLEGYHD